MPAIICRLSTSLKHGCRGAKARGLPFAISLLAGCASPSARSPNPRPSAPPSCAIDLRTELAYSATPQVAALAQPLAELRAIDTWILSLYLRKPSSTPLSKRVRLARTSFDQFAQRLRQQPAKAGALPLLNTCDEALRRAESNTASRTGALQEAAETAVELRALLPNKFCDDDPSAKALTTFRVRLNECRYPISDGNLTDAERRELVGVLQTIRTLVRKALELAEPFGRATPNTAVGTKAFLLCAHVRLCAYRSVLIADSVVRSMRPSLLVRCWNVVTLHWLEGPAAARFRETYTDLERMRQELTRPIRRDSDRRAQLDRLRELARRIPPTPAPGLDKAAVEMGAPPDFFQDRAHRKFVAVLDDRAVRRFCREALDNVEGSVRQLEQNLGKR